MLEPDLINFLVDLSHRGSVYVVFPQEHAWRGAPCGSRHDAPPDSEMPGPSTHRRALNRLLGLIWVSAVQYAEADFKKNRGRGRPGERSP